MAAQTLILLNPALISSPHHNSTSISLPTSYPKHNIYISHVSNISPSNPKLISPVPRKSKIFSSSSNTQNPTHSPLTESTRTITTFLAITLSISRSFSEKIKKIGVKLKKICTIPTSDDDELLAIEGIKGNLICSMGPMFFAAAINKGPRALNTPLTVVAAGMSKWLEIYSAVLMVRVLLSWFPNIPWDRQPLSAIRDLCDPYLNLFRNIIPPLFDTLDVSPLLAFAVLGSLAGILGATRPY